MALEYPQIEYAFRVWSALKHESGYDLLVSIAVPHPVHWGVALRRSGKTPIAATWVADCGDPYMGIDCDPFRCMPYFKYVEKYFCKRADFISVPVDGAINGYYPEFRPKIRIIPQGFNFEEARAILDDYEQNDIPTFGYAGTFMRDLRDPRPLLEYLTGLDREYRFIIYTPSQALVQPYLKASGGRIELREYVPRGQLLSVLSRMDFLLNMNNATNLQAPSKLIDYYLAGRPVLSLNSGEVDEEKINRFLRGDYGGRLLFEGIDQYRIENVCSKFIALCG